MTEIFVETNAAEIAAEIQGIADDIKEPMLTDVVNRAKNNALRLFRRGIGAFLRRWRRRNPEGASRKAVPSAYGVSPGKKKGDVRSNSISMTRSHVVLRSHCSRGWRPMGPGGSSSERLLS